MALRCLARVRASGLPTSPDLLGCRRLEASRCLSYCLPRATESRMAPGSLPGQEVGTTRSRSALAVGPSLLSVALVGIGTVGKELAAQILERKKSLQAEGIELNVVAVARSSKMWFMPQGLSSLEDIAKGMGEVADLKKLGEFMAGQPGSRIVVDSTADEAPVEQYVSWLERGINVVTPNKKMGSGPWERYDQAVCARNAGGGHFLYEATVGAGLPIVATLQDLLRTGDVVERIEGVFSGTLSYIFNSMALETPFSEVIKDAAAKGFTEPDPRDDLSGSDVQRKVIILARECGLKLELSDVPVQSLVPEPLQTWQPSAEEKDDLAASFVRAMTPYDAEMAARVKEAAAKDEVLRYVGVVDVVNGRAAVELRSFPNTHPFASTQYADNIVAFKTRRYSPRPLVVQGPGAGAAVTAGGVFGDMLPLAQLSRI